MVTSGASPVTLLSELLKDNQLESPEGEVLRNVKLHEATTLALGETVACIHTSAFSLTVLFVILPILGKVVFLTVTVKSSVSLSVDAGLLVAVTVKS